jgi:hypothetical protein
MFHVYLVSWLCGLPQTHKRSSTILRNAYRRFLVVAYPTFPHSLIGEPHRVQGVGKCSTRLRYHFARYVKQTHCKRAEDVLLPITMKKLSGVCPSNPAPIAGVGLPITVADGYFRQ